MAIGVAIILLTCIIASALSYNPSEKATSSYGYQPRSSHRSYSTSSTSSEASSSTSSEGTEEYYYKQGYDEGAIESRDLEWFLGNNEERLKHWYRLKALTEADRTNKTKYRAFRKGVIDGYKTQSALD